VLLKAVFHVYECSRKDEFILLDGRLLDDITKEDELLIIKGIDIDYLVYNGRDDGILDVDDNFASECVSVHQIISYEREWDKLPGMMSARLVCSCDCDNPKNMVLLKILNKQGCTK